MHFNSKQMKALSLVLFLGILTVPARGAFGEKAPVMEPKARQVLQQAGDFLKTAQSYTFAMETIKEVVLDTGQKLQFSAMHEVAVRKPDGVKILSEGDLGNFTLWYDGASITVHNSEQNLYSTEEVSDNIDAAFDQIADKKGITPPMVSLLYSDPVALMKDGVKSGFYVGLGRVRGVESHHLALTSEDVDTQIWVAAGLSPVIVKVVQTRKNETGAPQFAAYLSDWDLAPFLPDSLFNSVLPKSALLCDFSRFKTPDTDGK